LYYYCKNNKFIFSSEIKAILEHEINREVDLGALNHYFRLMYVPAPLTMFKNIYKLPQAHYLILKKGEIEIKKYWDVDDFKDIKSKEEIIERIQELTKESVRGQLISDRPVGIFLSGGIDSTSVLGITSQLLSDKIKTYTVGFEIYDPSKKFIQDILLARQTSQYYQTEHQELFVDSKDILDNITTVFYHMDEPIAEPTQIATFLLSGLAKKEVAVVLGGDGGDELFGGYKRYYYSYILSKYWATKTLPFLKSKLHTKFMFQKEEEISKILSKEINQTRITGKFFKEKYLKKYSVSDFEKLFMLIDLKTWLADESLMRTDKTTMAFGLEQRVPVLDHRLVELAMKIPSKYKMKDENQGKEIFIEAMKDYLPEHILKSDKKKVWMTPMSEWLRTDLNNFASEVLSPNYSSQTQNYFDFKGIEQIFIDHVERRQYNLNLIWALVTFQFWHKKFIEKND
jgi:asparagine synthase (glutamine-hydrolysing)